MKAIEEFKEQAESIALDLTEMQEKLAELATKANLLEITFEDKKIGDELRLFSNQFLPIASKLFDIVDEMDYLKS